MNIKAMRNIHLYLGVFFAPLLAFFLISGTWQTFGLHEASKSGEYKPPAIIKSLSSVHKEQKWTEGRQKGSESSVPFQWLVVLMAVGLLTTTILGIVMAFKYTKPWIVWGCLLMGIAVPYFLIWIPHG